MAKIDRRAFFFKTTQALGLFLTSNVALYAVGSAFKKLDGSLVAGAKTWQQTGSDAVPCPGTGFGNPRKTKGSPCIAADIGFVRYGSPACGSVEELECLP